MRNVSQNLDLVLIESGGDNLARPTVRVSGFDDLRDRRLGRRQDSQKRGPGITRSDLLVINKTDLAPHVGADLDVMDRDAGKCAENGRSSLPVFRSTARNMWRTSSKPPAASLGKEQGHDI